MRQIAILTLIAASSVAHAITPLETRNPQETVTLDYFMEACSVIGETANGLIAHFDCESYLYAIMDTQRALNPSLKPEQQACLPEKLAPWQLYEQIGAGIPDSEWAKPAAPSITRLLRQQYPCGTGNASEPSSGSCKAAEGETGLHACLNAELKNADDELNSAYQKLLSRYEESSAAASPKAQTQGSHLKEAQRAWIKLRDTSCDFETYESSTGSGFATIYTACQLQQTQKRVEYLNGLIEHP